MNLRLKLFLLLAMTASLAVFSSLSAFRHVQRTALHIADSEKTALLIQSVRAMVGEAQLAKDPLMLIDYLNFLDRDRAEVVGSRTRWDGNWRGAAPVSPGSTEESVETIVVPPASGSGEVLVELRLSRAVLRERLAKAEAELTVWLAEPTQWRLDHGQMVLMSANGQIWQFEADDNAQWRRVPDSADPLIMIRGQ